MPGRHLRQRRLQRLARRPLHRWRQHRFRDQPDGGLLDVTILSERPNPAEDGYFLAVVNGVPSKDVKPDPKDVVFVIDTSGSMGGTSIAQAREALALALEQLAPEDYFNIIEFDSSFSKLYGQSVPAMPAPLVNMPAQPANDAARPDIGVRSLDIGTSL